MEVVHVLLTLLAFIQTVKTKDHPPRFVGHYHFNVVENSPIGTILGRITAEDQDGAGNLTFQIADDLTSKIIAIKNVHQSRTRLTADVVTTAILDRDFAPTTRFLRISVTDGIHKVTTTVKLSISDVNDNAPQFLQHNYTVSIPAGTAMNSVIIIVTATDPDATFGQFVFYSIQTDDLFAYQAFSVNQYTGIITLHSPLITHRNKILHLNVTATDGGGLSSSANVAIHVY